MSAEYNLGATRQSRLDRIWKPVETNPEVVAYKIQKIANPPIRRVLQWVEIYVAPQSPTKYLEDLSRLLNGLTDLQRSYRDGGRVDGPLDHDRAKMYYPEHKFSEIVGSIREGKVKKIAVTDPDIEIDPAALTNEDFQDHPLKRVISLIAIPHPEIVDIIRGYKGSGKSNPTLNDLCCSISIKDLDTLMRGESPFTHLAEYFT